MVNCRILNKQDHIKTDMKLHKATQDEYRTECTEMLTAEFLTLGCLKSLQSSSVLSYVYVKGWEGRHASACILHCARGWCSCHTRGKFREIFSLRNYIPALYARWSVFAIAFIYPGSVVLKPFFFSHFDFSSTFVYTVWYFSFPTVQVAKKQAILINSLSVPTGRDEELVPSAHASSDATFCVFSK